LPFKIVHDLSCYPLLYCNSDVVMMLVIYRQACDMCSETDG